MNSLKINFFISLIILTSLNHSYSQVSLGWTRSYNPPVNHHQSANDVAVGDDGASYVLGHNGRGYNGADIALVKYNSSGEFRWAKSYDGGNENNSDLGKSVITYKSGTDIFIYAACDISISGWGNYAGLIKYDSSGNLIWNKNCNVGYNAKVSKVTVDISGNAYITGGSNDGAFVIKFNATGDTLWIKELPLFSDYTVSFGKDIVTDSSGNVYVTGFYTSTTSQTDVVTFKYSPSGVLLWSKVFIYLNIYEDIGNSIFYKSGFLYVTGSSDSSNGQQDIVTLKYNINTGDTLWVKRYNGTLNQYDDAKDIAVDNSGNIYVIGQANGATFSGDIATIKYNSSGNFQWIRIYAGSSGDEDAGKGLSLDTAGNIYVAGRINGGFGSENIGIKYNSNGDSLWTRLFDVGSSEEVNAIALDKNNNMIITGECDNLDMSTLKCNSSGQLQWMRKFYGAQLIYDYTNCVATDKNGNVYAAGKSRVAQFGDQFTVIKYNPEGTMIWYKSYGLQLYDNYDEAKAMAIDDAGYIYVTGTSYSKFNSSKDYLTFKLDSNGNQSWYALYNTPGNKDEDAKAIAVDNSGYVYVTGQSKSSVNNDDYLTIKYNPSGAQVWAAGYNGPGNAGDYAYDVAVDNSGNVYVTGQSGGTGTGDDIATVKYSVNGIILWAQRFNGSANGNDIGNTIELDNGSNVYVCGMAQENATGYNSVLIKYNSSGTLIWSRQDSSNDSLISIETANSIKLDSTESRIYLAGTWASYIDGRKTQFVAKYDSSGYRIYRSNTLFYYLGSESYTTGLYLDKNQNVYTSGHRIYSNGNPPEIILTAFDSSMNPYYGYNKGYKFASNGPEGRDVITVSDNGNIFIGGGIYDSTAGTLMSVIKYRQQPFEINLTLFIQGFYNSVSNSLMQDTVTVYIRSVTVPDFINDSSKAVLNSGGSGIFKFNSNLLSEGDPYLLDIRHRNSIETWTGDWVYFSYGSMNYNMATSANQAYGNNQVQIDNSPLRFGIYSGDENQDGYVNLSDVVNVFNNSNAFVNGYVSSDMTGDNITDLTDIVITYNNSTLFVGKISP